MIFKGYLYIDIRCSSTREIIPEKVIKMIKNPEILKGLQTELKSIEKQITAKLGDNISPKAAGQINNLLNKVSVRKAMPDFKVSFPVAEGVKEISITFTEFLTRVDTSISKEDKKILSALEKQRIGLVLLLEDDNKK